MRDGRGMWCRGMWCRGRRDLEAREGSENQSPTAENISSITVLDSAVVKASAAK